MEVWPGPNNVPIFLRWKPPVKLSLSGILESRTLSCAENIGGQQKSPARATMRISRRITAGLLLFAGMVHSAPADGRTNDDLIAVERIVMERCLPCHFGQEPAGELDLSRPDRAVRRDDPEVSLLKSDFWRRIADEEMPPDQPLKEDERIVLRRWLSAGAEWPDRAIDPLQLTTTARAGRDWWAFQPLTEPAIPRLAMPEFSANGIDAFVLRELHKRGLAMNPPASPRNLVRRLYFDLIGLPPPIEVVEQFEKSPSDANYLAIVDRLLNSPEYGERWARHWLDLVRFGESDGFERNAPREHSWLYRDWVIDALNRDLPYNEFARSQIAADSWLQDPRDVAAAQGYLVAGVHNTVVGSSRSMQLLARQDELEDLVGNIGQTFLGLTLNCARCHDHKFDPISQSEYYQLIAVLNGVSPGTVVVRSADDRDRLEQLEQAIRTARKSLRELELPARQQAMGLPGVELPVPILDFNAAGGTGQMTLQGGAEIKQDALVLDGKDDFAISPPLDQVLQEKTLEVSVRLSNLSQQGGAAISLELHDGSIFDAIVFAEQETSKWMAGSNFFQRTLSFGGEPESTPPDAEIHLAITYDRDGWVSAYRNGVPYGRPYQTTAPPVFPAGQARVLVGLRHSPASDKKFLGAEILRARLYDCALDAAEVQAAAAECGWGWDPKDLHALLPPEQWLQWNSLRAEISRLETALRELDAATAQPAYSHVSLQPEPVYFLPRGDVNRPGPAMSPGTTQALAVNPELRFPRLESNSDRELRRALAEWITSRHNPLFHRVISNRLWQYHFGTGLVATPSDLGFNGGAASHPELLDWLCQELKRSEYRLKPIHRLIVSSKTWRQAASSDLQGRQIDSDNRWLWRKTPHRLDAEVIRDSMLVVAGKLNPQRQGPGYRDVKVTDDGNGTTYYSEFDEESSDLNRRTVYRFGPRGGRPALLDSLDCPDPSTAAPRRTVTTTPLQALSLLNSPFVLRMCDSFAARAAISAPDLSGQITWMFRTAYSRPPTEEQLAAGCELAGQHGLAAVARAIFNSNEFVTVY